MTANRTCFLICPIGEPGSDIRKRADQLLRFVIQPSLSSHGLTCVRADKISEPGLINSQIIQHLIDDYVVIADLTDLNANVFYELATRHAVRKPFIQLIQREQRLPFDIAGMRTIQFDLKDLENVEEAKCEIDKQLLAIKGRGEDPVETPFSFSLELQILKESQNPFAGIISDIPGLLSEMRNQILHDLRGQIAALDQKLGSPDTLLPPAYFRHLFNDPRITAGSRSFRTIINETTELIDQVLDSGLLDEANVAHAQLRKRMEFILHMINREKGIQ